MATATGDVAYNFAAAANENPWSLADGGVGDPFVVRNGMTARIITNALRSNFNSNGYVCYVGQPINQNSFEVKGETLQSSGGFGDQVGVGAINSSGNGYILWINGNAWRLYQIDAFVIGSGVNLNTTHSALDVVSMQYAFSAGTVTLTAKLNGVATGLTLSDTTSPYNGDLEPCWFFNFDNSNAGGFRSISFDGLAVAGVTIDSTPADIRVTESRTIRVTAPTTAMTTGNTAVRIDDAGNSPITPSAVTNISGLTYDVVFTVPDEYAGLPYSATGYPIIVTTADGSVTSANVDFLPVTGNGDVTLTDVSDTDIESSPALEVDDQIEWTNASVITIGTDGKVTSTEESATFEFRVWDHNDSTWGDWAEVVFGEGGGGGSGGITISGLSSSGISGAGITS